MKAIDNWYTANFKEKIEIANKLVKNQSTKLKKIENVVAVGYGRREKNGQLTNEVCIKISVSQKKNSKELFFGGIPQYVLTTCVNSDGVRRAYAVPTDVTELSDLKLQGGIGGSATLSRRGNYGENGTVCCYVKFFGYNNYYALGCAHTFALISRLNKPPIRDFINNVTYSQNADGSIRGNLGYLQVIGALNKVDAAVVSVTDFQELSSGFGDNNYAFNGISNDLYSNNYLIHTRRGSFEIDWVENIKRLSLTYHVNQNSKTYTFNNIIRSLVLRGQTLAGDSGSPITTFNGELLAMHFAGDGTHSYALPIQQVFNAFNPPLNLAT